MPETSAVTSFSEEGFDIYGRTFLKSWLAHADIPIRVYIETDQPSKKHPKDKRIEYKNLMVDVPSCPDFIRDCPPVKGGYRFDAAKFCRKIYAQLDILSEPFDAVYWFDADVILQRKLDEKLLKGWIKDVAVAYLGRDGFHCCSSFVGYNPNHPDLIEYWNGLHKLYNHRTLFTLKDGWTDCDAMAKAMWGLATRNICEGNPAAKGAANVFDFYLPGHHKKGNRKYAGG